MIVVEGSDLVGKSTLCVELAARIGRPIQHWGPLPQEFDYFESYVRAIGPYVYDRFILSELVYSAIARGHFKLQHWNLLQALMLAQGAVVIIMTQDDDTLRARYKRPEMFKLDLIQEVNLTYHNITRMHAFRGLNVHYDYHIRNYDEEFIERVVRDWQARQALVSKAADLLRHHRALSDSVDMPSK